MNHFNISVTVRRRDNKRIMIEDCKTINYQIIFTDRKMINEPTVINEHTMLNEHIMKNESIILNVE